MAKDETESDRSVAAEVTSKTTLEKNSDAATDASRSGRAGRSGNPAKAASSRGSGRSSKRVDPFRDPNAGPVLSLRFGVAILLVVVGIAWIAYYYVGVRPSGGFGAIDLKTGKPETAGGPGFMGDLKGWNYVIGFALFFLGLIVSAHPSTPLGRGRGVVTGMLGCFLLGLAWICVFYAIANDTSKLPVFNDLGQKNLIVGIVFMAVGFTFAILWE